MIISTNTTWSGTVVLSEKVQIAEGVTLTLASGTKVLGDPNIGAVAIEVFGALRTASTGDRAVFANVRISLEGNTEAASTANRVVIDNALLYGSTVENHNEFGGSLEISNSQLQRTPVTSWYLDKFLVTHSVLVDSALSVGVDGRNDGRSAGIKDALLVQSTLPVPPLTVWASYGGPVALDGSTILVENQPAIRLTNAGGIDGVGLKGHGNYIYGSRVSTAGLIIDHNDDLQVLGSVQLSESAGTYSSTAPKLGDVLSIGQLGQLLPFGPGITRTNGTAGNDILVVSEGDTEIVDGKAGTDVFVRGLLSSLVTITGDAHERHIYYTANLYNHPTTLIDVERIQFIDRSVAFDLGGDAGFVARLIGTVFGASNVRNPTYVGVGLRELDAGTPRATLAQLAATVGGLTTPETTVKTLWKNLTGTTPTAAEMQPYLDLLAGGMPVGQFVAIAAQSDFAAAAIDLVGLTESGLYYI